jgi:hypothetical protein
MSNLMFRHLPFLERFWIYVEKTDECWLWHGPRADSGHGFIMHRGKKLYAHRVSYKLHRGPLTKGMSVLHSCDVPFCVKPDHFFLGTQTDNMLDMWAKGRGKNGTLPGSRNSNARLTEERVQLLKLTPRFPQETDNAYYTRIGDEYGVGRQSIRKIFLGRTWKHVA